MSAIIPPPASRGRPSGDVESQIGERDFGLGALDTDGADEQAHFRLLMREDVLDPCANAGFCRVAAPDIRGHWFALGLPAMNAADPALGLEPTLIALAAIGRVGPDIRSGVVVGDDITQHPPIVARSVGRLALADKAKGPADGDAASLSRPRSRVIYLTAARAHSRLLRIY